MAEITIQDVATYLAEHGYATWAELTTRKMLTEDGMWTRLQSNYDSARAIDPRYITFPTVDLSAYATETWVQQQGYLTSHQSLSGYATQSWVRQWVQQQGYITTVPSLSGYATQSWVQQQGFLTQHQSLSDYATQQWVTARIQSSVSGFASQAWVGQTFLQLSGGTMTGDIESQDIIPVTDNTYSLGTSAKRWSIIRTMNADFAGEIYTHGKVYAYANIQPMPNSNSVYPQLGTSAARWANVLTSGVNSAGNIIPSTTETYQLGTQQYRWNNVVTKSINATGTSSLAALSVSGSATFNNGINVATGSLTIGGCTISWDSAVSMLHFSTGIYSDGAVTAGGVGTSGGGGGGGLTWANLDAATTEQINHSHLTTALAGYVELTGAQTISGVKTFSSQLTVSGRYCIGGWQQEDSYIRANDINIQGAYSLTFGLSNGSRQIYIEDGDNIAVTGNVDVSGNIDTDGAVSANGNVTASGFIHDSYNSSDYLLTGNGEAISKSTLLNGYATTGQLHSHSNKSTLDGITSTKVSNWDTAYGWGNHATQGYLTSLGSRPSLYKADGTVLGSGNVVYLPLTGVASGYYTLDYATICANYVTTGTEQTISEKKTFSKGIVANGVTHPTYNNSDYLLHGGGGVIHISTLRDNMSAATTNGNNTFTGTNTFTKEIYMSGTRAIVFNNDSGIAANRSDELELYGNNGVRITSDSLVVDGTVTASGYRNSSDLRRKNLYGDIALSVADIAAMPAVRFRWNSGRDTQAMHVGTIAQAWQTLLPEVVTQGSDGLLSMDYASAAMVSVINVAKSVSDHERRILDLEAENRRLKTELEQLKV